MDGTEFGSGNIPTRGLGKPEARIDPPTLLALANELEAIGPMTKEHYVRTIRLYATEPWRLQPALREINRGS